MNEASTTEAQRTARGTADFNGWWNGAPPGRGGGVFGGGSNSLTLPARGGDLGNFEKDFAVMERRHDNLPVYKPEYWEQIRYNDYYGLVDDPVFGCRPAGLPRMGPPHKIVQNEGELVFLYSQLYPEGDVYRIIPTDGREFDQLQRDDWTWYGHSLGHWEGDTLVIESVGFSNESWLNWAGWTHSSDMRVVERITREGNALHWEVTVYDPVMFQEPWHLHEETRWLNTDENVWVYPALPCEELDSERIVDPTVRG